MGTRRIAKVGSHGKYFGNMADWMAKLARDARTKKDKKNKRKENRKRDADAQSN